MFEDGVSAYIIICRVLVGLNVQDLPLSPLSLGVALSIDSNKQWGRGLVLCTLNPCQRLRRWWRAVDGSKAKGEIITLLRVRMPPSH